MIDEGKGMYKIRRALAVTAFFLEKGQGRMNDMKLAKLQYLSERMSILSLMAPITCDAYVSLPHGPCLSKTLELTRTQDHTLWRQHIRFESHTKSKESENTVVLLAPFDFRSELSEADLELLERIWGQFGKMTKWQIRDWCHKNCPEYTETVSSLPISLESLFAANGCDEQEARQMAEEIRYLDRFESEYGSASA